MKLLNHQSIDHIDRIISGNENVMCLLSSRYELGCFESIQHIELTALYELIRETIAMYLFTAEVRRVRATCLIFPDC